MVLFKCVWWNLGAKSGLSGIRKDKYGFTGVNTNSTWYKDQPYALAHQVKQCYYIPDLKLGSTWKLAIKNTPRDEFDFSGEEDDVSDPYQQLVGSDYTMSMDVDDHHIQLRRFDIPSEDNVSDNDEPIGEQQDQDNDELIFHEGGGDDDVFS